MTPKISRHRVNKNYGPNCPKERKDARQAPPFFLPIHRFEGSTQCICPRAASTPVICRT
jgi:hypothetical protein